MFLHLSVILFKGGGYNVTSCLATRSLVLSGGGVSPSRDHHPLRTEKGVIAQE